MKEIRERTALVTGAGGGIGRCIARTLAREGAHVVLAGLESEATALAQLAEEVRAAGVRAEAVTGDLAVREERGSLVERAEAAAGPIDILVNNAGIEMTSAYTCFADEELERIATVNFIAPVVLTRHALVGMTSRGFGHVVFLSSMAAKFGSAFNEPYAATKAALIGLSQSLRREFHRSPIGFSAVCPTFVSDVGMYARMEEEGARAPFTVPSQRVADAVVSVIRKDKAEVVVSSRTKPAWPVLALTAIAPRLGERVALSVRTDDVFETIARQHGRLPELADGADGSARSVAIGSGETPEVAPR